MEVYTYINRKFHDRESCSAWPYGEMTPEDWAEVKVRQLTREGVRVRSHKTSRFTHAITGESARLDVVTEEVRQR